MMNIRTMHYWLAIMMLQVVVGGITSTAQRSTKTSVPASQADAAYGAGIRAMNEGQWDTAISSFSKASSDPNGIHGDASLYWKAYSYRRLALRRQSMQTCGLLRTTYPNSTWNQDCDALLLEMKQNSRAFSEESGKALPPIPPDSADVGSDDDLKLLALNALLHRSPDEGASAARRMLKSDAQIATKQQVLFVLTQAPSQHSVLLLKDAMRGSFGAITQAAAFRIIIQYSTIKDPAAGVAAYRSTKSRDTKIAVIDALAKWQDWADLVILAKEEHDPILHRRFVFALSKADDPVATEYLKELLR